MVITEYTISVKIEVPINDCSLGFHINDIRVIDKEFAILMHKGCLVACSQSSTLSEDYNKENGDTDFVTVLWMLQTTS